MQAHARRHDVEQLLSKIQSLIDAETAHRTEHTKTFAAGKPHSDPSAEINAAVVAPARVSSEVVARVGQAIREATELPDVEKRMSTLGFNIDFRNSDQFREMIVRDRQKYGSIIREAGIEPD